MGFLTHSPYHASISMGWWKKIHSGAILKNINIGAKSKRHT